MVGGRDKGTPPGLFDCRRIPIIETGYRPESIVDNDGGIDCRHWPPKQEVVLPMHNSDLRVGTDDVDHGRQSGRLEETEAARAGKLTGDAVVGSVRVCRPEERDGRLIGCAQAAGVPSIQLDLVELIDPPLARQPNGLPRLKLPDLL